MAATPQALLRFREFIKDDLPTLGYPMTPTVKDEWGVDRAYCFNRCNKAGAPREDDVVGSEGSEGVAD